MVISSESPLVFSDQSPDEQERILHAQAKARMYRNNLESLDKHSEDVFHIGKILRDKWQADIRDFIMGHFFIGSGLEDSKLKDMPFDTPDRDIENFISDLNEHNKGAVYNDPQDSF
jgi:hypothetical protein